VRRVEKVDRWRWVVEWVCKDGVMDVMAWEEDESAIACVTSCLRWAWVASSTKEDAVRVGILRFC